jgi:riboflavin synthase
MFTGIIQALGSVSTLSPAGENMQLRIAAGGLPLADVSLGDSIAVNGVCLTVTDLGQDDFCAVVSPETLRCTTLAALTEGAKVNLEKALALGDRLGGHLVSGHVDGVARVIDSADEGKSMRFAFTVPPPLERYVARKGSVCIDGVSLTVNAVEGEAFSVQIIPHTRDHTLFGTYRIGDRVNIEVDLIARYLERLFPGADAPAPQRYTV